MEINIRESIRNNFKNTSLEEIKSTIEDSLEKEEEITLPGMGVFFEILWTNCSQEMKSQILDTIEKNL